MDNVKNGSAGSGLMVANDLRSGLTVFLTDSGDWTEQVSNAWIVSAAHRAHAQQIASEAEAKNVVTGVYLVDCDDLGRPLSLRERLRIKGPSVDYLPPENTSTAALKLQAGA